MPVTSDRLVADFFEEHRARYRIIEEREWQEEFERASLQQKCSMLMLKETKTWVVDLFTQGTARFGSS